MTMIRDEINQMAIATAQERDKEEHVTGTASAQLTQTEFLDLMLKQYEYQDPMEPMDIKDMVAQQCQFSQLSATQELANSITANNSVIQATSLVGKSVVLRDPDNTENVIYGTVDAAYIDGSDSCVTVGGKNYPLKYVMYAYNGETTNVSTDANNSGTVQANGNS